MSFNTRLFVAVLTLSFCAAGCKNEASAAESKSRESQMEPTAEKNADNKTATEAAPKPAPAPSAAPVKEADESAKSAPASATGSVALPTETPTDIQTESTRSDDKVELVAAEGLQLAELTVARGIEDKKPLDPKTAYKLGEFEKITAFMSVLNPEETADEIHVSFRNLETGHERGKVTVSVGAQKKWRTWAYTKSIRKTGKWEILVRDSNEQLLGRAPFEILPAE